MQRGNYKPTSVNRLETIWPEPESPGTGVAVRKATWTEAAKGWEGRLESFLAEHPKLAIAAAAAAGIALGWIVKRK